MLLEKTQKKKRKERNDIEPTFNIRYEFAFEDLESLVTVSSYNRSQVLFIPERTHALAHREKGATGFRRFVLVRPKTIGNGGLFGL